MVLHIEFIEQHWNTKLPQAVIFPPKSESIILRFNEDSVTATGGVHV